MTDVLATDFASRCQQLGLAEDGQIRQGASADAEQALAAVLLSPLACPLADCAVLYQVIDSPVLPTSVASSTVTPASTACVIGKLYFL